MDILTSEDFVSAVVDGRLDCRVVIDNDCVHAFQQDIDGKEEEYGENWILIFDFDGKGPQGVLLDLFVALGVKAELS
jgi:hypothetical protein